jgi:hypothetical protein
MPSLVGDSTAQGQTFRTNNHDPRTASKSRQPGETGNHFSTNNQMKDKVFLTVGDQRVVTSISATNGPGGIIIQLGTDTLIEISAENFGRLVASVASATWQK